VLTGVRGLLSLVTGASGDASLILPVLGDYPLGQLASRPSLVQGWLRGPSGSAGNARLIFTTLSTVLNAAVADELIPKNPCHVRNVTRPKRPARRIEP
jgi:hypothetical protein